MKIIIIEFVHYQYAITLTELFKEHEIIYIFSDKIRDSLIKFAPDFNPKNIWTYNPENLENEKDELILKINNESADLFCINPIFNNFKFFAEISKKITTKKILTTHNINTWFRPSIRNIRDFKEKKFKKQIINNCEYIAVEDFIFSHLESEEPKLFNKYNFIYIPFTLFNEKYNKINRDDRKIKIVLPGSIDYERRRYETTIVAINEILKENQDFIFSFAGPAIGEYGRKILNQLKNIKQLFPENIIIFEQQPKPDEFKYEMESADIVLSTSTKYFYTLGTKETIGKTKPTAAIHDMISFVMPGILPSHLKIPAELSSSSQQYSNAEELMKCLKRFSSNTFSERQKNEALLNSKKFTPQIILEKNPNLNF